MLVIREFTEMLLLPAFKMSFHVHVEIKQRSGSTVTADSVPLGFPHRNVTSLVLPVVLCSGPVAVGPRRISFEIKLRQ